MTRDQLLQAATEQCKADMETCRNILTASVTSTIGFATILTFIQTMMGGIHGPLNGPLRYVVIICFATFILAAYIAVFAANGAKGELQRIYTLNDTDLSNWNRNFTPTRIASVLLAFGLLFLLSIITLGLVFPSAS